MDPNFTGFESKVSREQELQEKKNKLNRKIDKCILKQEKLSKKIEKLNKHIFSCKKAPKGKGKCKRHMLECKMMELDLNHQKIEFKSLVKKMEEIDQRLTKNA